MFAKVRRLTRGLLVGALTGVLSMSFVPVSQAAMPNFIGINGVHQMGTFRGPTGEQVICIDTSGPNYVPLIDIPKTATKPVSKPNWKAAYAIDRWINTKDRAYAAALWKYVGSDLKLNSRISEVDRSWKASATAEAKKAYKDIVSQTNAYAGPYKANKFKIKLNSDGKSGVVPNIGVLSNSGKVVSGKPATITLEGPAVWKKNGKKTLSFTTSNKLISEQFNVTGPGKVKAYFKATDLSYAFKLYPSPKKGEQRVVTTKGEKTFVDGKDPAGVTVKVAEPRAVSEASDRVVSAGSEISDTVVVSGAWPGSKVSGVSDLFGPFVSMPTSVDQLPAKPVASVKFSTTVDAKGAGRAVSGKVKVDKAGFYVWRERLNADAFNKAFQAGWPVAKESTVVYAPRVSSKISAGVVRPGGEISDTVILAGIEPKDGFGDRITTRVSGGLYGPIAPNKDGGCDGLDWSAAERALDIAGFDVVKSGEIAGLGKYTIPADAGPGCYSYGYELVWRDAKGNTGKVTHAAGDVSQTSLVYAPRLVSKVSAALVGAGQVLSDTLIVSGVRDVDVAGGKVSTMVSGGLYGPMAPVAKTVKIRDDAGLEKEVVDQCGGVDWSKAAKLVDIASFDVTKDGEIPGLGEYKIPADAVSGCYSYGYELVWKDTTGNTGKVTHAAGDVSQTALVYAPKITTMVSEQKVAAGAEISDTVSPSSVMTSHMGIDISNTVSGGLYGPLPPNRKGGCDGLDWSKAAKVADIASLPVSSNDPILGVGRYKVPGDAGPGCYTYGEDLVWSWGNTTGKYHHKAGEVTQTSLVRPSSGGMIATGGRIDDTATGWWLVAAGAVLALVVVSGVGVARWRGRRVVPTRGMTEDDGQI